MAIQRNLKSSIFWVFILLGLLFTPIISTAQTETLSQIHKHFYRSGSILDIDQILDINKTTGREVKEVSVVYNMIRSKLEVDWLFNGEVIGHTILPRGLVKKVSFFYNKPLPGSVEIKFTGPSGQLQVASVSATVVKFENKLQMVSVSSPTVETARPNYSIIPTGLKAACQTADRSCPILKWGDYTYWAYSYNDNRTGMVIVAYNKDKQAVQRWNKMGARYLNKITVDDVNRKVTFWGQSNSQITMTWDELRSNGN